MKLFFLYMKKNIKEGKFLTIFRKLIVTMSELTLPNMLQTISKPV